MASVVGLVGIVVIVAVNAAVAAVATRFFRLRLATSWGPVVYVAILVPPALVALTLVLSGVFGLGSNLGSTSTALLVAVVVPLALGVSVDLFWMPPPEEVELPERSGQ